MWNKSLVTNKLRYLVIIITLYGEYAIFRLVGDIFQVKKSFGAYCTVVELVTFFRCCFWNSHNTIEFMLKFQLCSCVIIVRNRRQCSSIRLSFNSRTKQERRPRSRLRNHGKLAQQSSNVDRIASRRGEMGLWTQWAHRNRRPQWLCVQTCLQKRQSACQCCFASATVGLRWSHAGT